MPTKVITLKAQQYQVGAWEAAAAKTRRDNRNEWCCGVLDGATGRGSAEAFVTALRKVKLPTEPQTRATTVTIPIRATEIQADAWAVAAREAGLSRHAWMLVMLDIAAGVSRLPDQIGRLIVQG